MGNTRIISKDVVVTRVGLGCMGFSHAYGAPTEKGEALAMIRAWGISETTEEYLRRAHAVCPVAAIQNRYSMLAREHEKIFSVLEELGITFVAFSPLGNGFLAGKYNTSSSFDKGTDFRSHMPQYTEEGFKAAEDLMKLLNQMAEEKNASSGQFSLAWMLCKKPYIVPIPGSRKEERLKENLRSKDVVLTTEEIAGIDTLLDKMVLPVYGQNPARK